MYPTLLYLYGPIYIQSYGTMIALGVLLGYILLRNDRYLSLAVSVSTIDTLITLAIVSGLVGGRLWYLISEQPTYLLSWIDLFKLWSGGLSVLGALIGIITSLSMYIRYKQLPLGIIFDAIAVHAPLVQAISRIGCFLSGCCYGAISSWSFLTITYTNPLCHAPLQVPLHPAQLYSSFAQLLIFFYLVRIRQYHSDKPGILTCIFIMLYAIERGLIDILRGDRTFTAASIFHILSINQWLAIILFIAGGIGYQYITYRKTE